MKKLKFGLGLGGAKAGETKSVEKEEVAVETISQGYRDDRIRPPKLQTSALRRNKSHSGPVTPTSAPATPKSSDSAALRDTPKTASTPRESVAAQRSPGAISDQGKTVATPRSKKKTTRELSGGKTPKSSKGKAPPSTPKTSKKEADDKAQGLKSPRAKEIKSPKGLKAKDSTKNLGETLCEGCGKPFGAGDSTVRNFGKSWHVEHYVCRSCPDGSKLSGEVFLDGSDLLCAEHYWAMKADRCSVCGEPILREKLRAGSKGSVMHPDCFCCTVCGQSLLEVDALEHEGKFLCKKDYKKATSEACSVCTKPMEGIFVVVMGKKRHQACLTCATCSRTISASEELVEFDGEIYCAEHDPEADILNCKVCGKSLVGKPYFRTFWEEPFCEDHETELGKCITCGQDVCEVPQSVKRSKAKLCMHCRTGTTKLQDKDVFGIMTSLKEIGVDPAERKFVIKLQEKVAHKFGGEHSLRDDGKYVFSVDRSLNNESALCALAHAVVHAFLSDLPPVVIEPIARYAEYHCMATWRDSDASDAALRQDAFHRREKLRLADEYFRSFELTMKRSGGSAKEVISYVKENGELPPDAHFVPYY